MSYFQMIVERTAGLRPGTQLEADDRLLGEGWGGELGEFVSGGFAPPDRVLERVIGSSVTHRWYRDFAGRLIFERLHSALPDGVRSYVSPDRRALYTRRADGLYETVGFVRSLDAERAILCALGGHEWQRCMIRAPDKPIQIEMTIGEELAESTIAYVEEKRCARCGIIQRPESPATR